MRTTCQTILAVVRLAKSVSVHKIVYNSITKIWMTKKVTSPVGGMADAGDLNSPDLRSCGFESHTGHYYN